MPSSCRILVLLLALALLFVTFNAGRKLCAATSVRESR